MVALRLMLRKEWPLILSYGSLIALLVAPEAILGGLESGTRIGLIFGWLFVVILLSAFSVVHHAESLAQKLGEPYGTLILTLSVIGLEVLMIATVMITKDENPKMARDTMYGVLMIVLNGLFGMSLLLGAWRHRFQNFNFQSSDTYIGCIIVLIGVGLFLPRFVPDESLLMFEIYLIVACMAFYGVFLWVQTREHRGFFEYQTPEGAVVECDHPESPFGVGYHIALLVITLIPIVLLAKQLSVVMDVALLTLGAPDALAGLAVAILILAPEGLAAINAARHNNLQRALNICLGSGVATIGLTIPVVLVIAMIVDQDLVLGLEPEEMVLVCMTVLLLIVNLDKGQTNVFKGALHLVLFGTYVVFVFA
jgi:Ca2+:H+ antiporter